MHAVPPPPGDRTEVTFDSSGTSCAAWLFLPHDNTAPPPVVVMAHGFGGVRGSRLDAFAARFAEAGIAALTFDYRGFGASGGETRDLVDPRAQRADYRAAVRWVRAQPNLDGSRIALWGTSFSGGHVLQLAAEDPSLRSVVAMVPHVDGLATLGAIRPTTAARVLSHGVADAIAGRTGRPRRRIPAIGEPGEVAAMTAPGSLQALRRIVAPDGSHPESVLAASVLPVGGYRPGSWSSRIAAPLLIQLAGGDNITPPGPARRAACRAPRGEVRTYPGGHFDVYVDPVFEQVVGDQVAFLSRHLQEQPAAAVAVVTGAGGGLGKALALQLARRGHAVGCLDINRAAAERTAALVRVAGRDAVVVTCDVRDAGAVAEAADVVEQQLGPIDVWVNNAGVGIGGDVGVLEPDDWRWMTDINLLGVVWGCHEAVRRMRPRGRGRILNIASLAAVASPPHTAPYNAAKAAVVSLTETLRGELRKSGITATVACPAYFETPLVETIRATDDYERRRQAVLMSAAASGTPDTVAAAAVDGMTRGRLYVFPQPDARLIGMARRWAPTALNTASAVITERRSRRLLGPEESAQTRAPGAGNPSDRATAVAIG